MAVGDHLTLCKHLANPYVGGWGTSEKAKEKKTSCRVGSLRQWVTGVIGAVCRQWAAPCPAGRRSLWSDSRPTDSLLGSDLPAIVELSTKIDQLNLKPETPITTIPPCLVVNQRIFHLPTHKHIIEIWSISDTFSSFLQNIWLLAEIFLGTGFLCSELLVKPWPCEHQIVSGFRCYMNLL